MKNILILEIKKNILILENKEKYINFRINIYHIHITK